MRALSALAPKNEGNRGGKGGKGGRRNNNNPDCFKIVKMIMERNYQPVIVFSFSKRECEAYLFFKN